MLPRRRAIPIRIATLLSIACALPLIGAPRGSAAPPAAGERPALVLFVVVDQLRGDVLPGARAHLSADGLGGLLDRGVFFDDAHYRHATTYTSVGHATLVTGAGPDRHGIVGNDWYSLDERRRVYSCDDPRQSVLGEDAKPPFGSSPRNLIGSTIGDELILSSGGRSRVFAVSGKDRGAILTAGRLGAAYWYSKSGRFVTSTYYASDYPAWAERHHRDGGAAAYAGRAWELRDHPATYAFGDQDDRPYEMPPKGLGRTFPHPLPSDVPAAASAIRATPLFDALTVDFACALIDAEHVGQGPATDMLVVSLSATDYIGHAFGPDSLEAEDNVRQLDRTVARLLAHVDARVGLDRTAIVLSSDHGVDRIPEHHLATRREAEHGAETREHAGDAADPDGCSAGRHVPEQLLADLDRALRDRFHVDRSLVVAFWNPSFYLDEEALADLGIDLDVAEDLVASELLAHPGVARAFTRHDLVTGDGPDDAIARMVRRSFHPRRSGHVIVVQEPFWFLHPEWDKHAAMHGSPYAYDTHVPVLFVLPGRSPARVSRRIGPEDIAPTLSAWLGVPRPAMADGEVLPEVMGG